MSLNHLQGKNLQEKGLLLKHDPLKPPHEVLAFRTESLSILIHHVGEPENQQKLLDDGDLNKIRRRIKPIRPVWQGVGLDLSPLNTTGKSVVFES